MARRSPSDTPLRRGTTATRKAKSSAQSKALAAKKQETAFVDALSVDFTRHGASAISRLREDDPVTYMKLCASVLPKAVIDSIDPLDSFEIWMVGGMAAIVGLLTKLAFWPD